MSGVLAYIDQFEGQQRYLMLYLRDLMLSIPEVSEKISYRIPFFYRKSWICYINATKDGGVEFAFTRANELSNEQGILDFKDRKQVASLVIYSIREVPEKELLELIQEALILDEKVPYNVKKK